MRISVIILLVTVLASCRTNHIAVVSKNGKVGCINKKGVWEIEPVWDYILLDDVGKPNLVERDSLYGFINRKGEILIEPKYSDADLFSEGLALVANSQYKYGFINLKGDTVIDFKYDENAWGEFSNGLADVILNEKSGYINKSGKIEIPLIYEICYPFWSDIEVVMDSTDNFKLIDKNGVLLDYNEKNIGNRKICPPKESYPGSFTTLRGNGRTNENGDTIVPPIYKVTGNLSNNMYIVKDKNNKWGAYNSKGQLTVIPQFDFLRHFNDGVSSFTLNGKCGFVNKKGEIVIEPRFDYASRFENGLAYVELNSKAGFINMKGKVIIPIIYEPYRMTGFE